MKEMILMILAAPTIAILLACAVLAVYALVRKALDWMEVKIRNAGNYFGEEQRRDG